MYRKSKSSIHSFPTYLVSVLATSNLTQNFLWRHLWAFWYKPSTLCFTPIQNHRNAFARPAPPIGFQLENSRTTYSSLPAPRASSGFQLFRLSTIVPLKWHYVIHYMNLYFRTLTFTFFAIDGSLPHPFTRSFHFLVLFPCVLRLSCTIPAIVCILP